MSIQPLVISSNMLNEYEELSEWFDFVQQIADGGILIVDGGSTDGTIEYAKSRGAVVVVDNIIQREGYGPARNHLREQSRKHFPKARWMMYLDADERIDEEDFHQLRYLKDYLIDDYDVIALPRIDWEDRKRKKAHNDYLVAPDWQARMSRLHSPVVYLRRLHEQVSGYKGILTRTSNPKINHLHRTAGQEKRDFVGKLCAKLHAEDKDYGHTYPKHHKEQMYYERYLKEGL